MSLSLESLDFKRLQRYVEGFVIPVNHSESYPQTLLEILEQR